MMKLIEIIKENNLLGEQLPPDLYSVTVLSNVIVQQSKEILEYTFRKEGIPAVVQFGNYDNILQDSTRFQASSAIIIFWELCNMIDGLQYKVNLMSDEELETLLSKIKGEIDFLIAELKQSSLVIMNKFSTLLFNHHYLRENRFDEICHHLNQYLKDQCPVNFFLIDTDKVIAKVSVKQSFNPRFFYSSKVLYTIDFFSTYAKFIVPLVCSINGKAKKILVCDCDDTLWKGIVGEEGFDHIYMSGKENKGVVFEEVQHLALALNKAGVPIGLCSKNNLEDVDKVLEKHPDMMLRSQNITIKKVNWQDKATNLRQMAQDLNVGIDSFVFIDDSDFEVNFVRGNIPDMTVVQVPKESYLYPELFRNASILFFNAYQTKEDSEKVAIYAREASRTESRKAFGDLDDYLKSLDLCLTLYRNKVGILPRMSQMTQKTNQFNLTTKRYTEADISQIIKDGSNAWALAFSVSDKFGDSGITGLAILQRSDREREVIIDTFLMSCRVLGRNIELSFMDHLIVFLKEQGVTSVRSSFIPTVKNEQVCQFYDKLGFSMSGTENGVKLYSLDINNYIFHHLNYIKVQYGK